MRKVAVIASASGNGKTPFGREVARRLDVPFIEMDALVHGPGWTETPDDELLAKVEPIRVWLPRLIRRTRRRMRGREQLWNDNRLRTHAGVDEFLSRARSSATEAEAPSSLTR